MGSAIATGNVDIILAILPRQHFIAADWISFAIVKCQDARLLSALVKRGINPNYTAHGGKPPLVFAVTKLGDTVGLFDELIEAGACLEKCNVNIYDEVLLQANLGQRLRLLLALLRKYLARDYVSIPEVRGAIEELGHGFEAYKLLFGNFLMAELPVEIRIYLLQLMLHKGLSLLLA
jgi:hypothetical protein